MYIFIYTHTYTYTYIKKHIQNHINTTRKGTDRVVSGVGKERERSDEVVADPVGQEGGDQYVFFVQLFYALCIYVHIYIDICIHMYQ